MYLAILMYGFKVNNEFSASRPETCIVQIMSITFSTPCDVGNSEKPDY